MGLGYSTGTQGTPDDYHYVPTQPQPVQKGELFDLFQARAINNAEEKASIFSFSKAKGPAKLKLATHAVNKLKGLRHYGIIKYLAGKDTPTEILVAVEPVVPLSEILGELTYEEVFLGLHQLLSTVSFLHTSCKVSHSNLTTKAIFVNPNETSDWKVGDFSFCCNMDDAEKKSLQESAEFQEKSAIPAEFLPGSPYPLDDIPIHSRDAWAIGVLIEELSVTLPKLAQTAEFQKLIKSFKEENPKSRPTPGQTLENAFFSENPLVHVAKFLKEITIQTPDQKEQFFKTLFPKIQKLSINTLVRAVVPRLLKFQILIQPEAQHFLPYFFKPSPAGLLPKAEYEKHIVTFLLWAFTLSNRHLRVALLRVIEHYLPHLNTEARQNLYTKVMRGLSDNDDTHVSETMTAVLTFTKFMLTTSGIESLSSTIQPIIQLVSTHQSAIVRNSALQFLAATLQLEYNWPTEELTLVLRSSLQDAQTRLYAITFGASLCQKLTPHQSVAVLQTLSPCLVDSNRDIQEATKKALVSISDIIIQRKRQLDSEHPPTTPLSTSTPAAATSPVSSPSKIAEVPWATDNTTNADTVAPKAQPISPPINNNPTSTAKTATPPAGTEDTSSFNDDDDWGGGWGASTIATPKAPKVEQKSPPEKKKNVIDQEEEEPKKEQKPASQAANNFFDDDMEPDYSVAPSIVVPKQQIPKLTQIQTPPQAAQPPTPRSARFAFLDEEPKKNEGASTSTETTTTDWGGDLDFDDLDFSEQPPPETTATPTTTAPSTLTNSIPKTSPTPPVPSTPPVTSTPPITTASPVATPPTTKKITPTPIPATSGGWDDDMDLDLDEDTPDQNASALEEQKRQEKQRGEQSQREQKQKEKEKEDEQRRAEAQKQTKTDVAAKVSESPKPAKKETKTKKKPQVEAVNLDDNDW